MSIVDEGVNYETHAHLEHWDFCARNVDEAWYLLEWLARDTYEFETSYVDSCIPSHCIPNYAPLVCEHCNRSDYDSNSCPCNISVDGFARLFNMIETMNEQQLKLTNFMQEHDLS